MISSASGGFILNSSGHLREPVQQFAICSDCGRLIPIVPGVAPKPEGYPIVSINERGEILTRHECQECREKEPE